MNSRKENIILSKFFLTESNIIVLELPSQILHLNLTEEEVWDRMMAWYSVPKINGLTCKKMVSMYLKDLTSVLPIKICPLTIEKGIDIFYRTFPIKIYLNLIDGFTIFWERCQFNLVNISLILEINFILKIL